MASFILRAPLLFDSIARFVRQRGTPSPTHPTDRLVVTGLYRHVRNPMYVGVVLMVAGQGLFFGSRPVLLYAALLGIGFHGWVVVYEEPHLRKRFPADYPAYCRAVRRWLPRLSSWSAQGPRSAGS